MFKIGDVVRLAGGGGLMTVDRIEVVIGSPEVIVHCLWFEGTTLKRNEYAPEWLEHADPIR